MGSVCFSMRSELMELNILLWSYERPTINGHSAIIGSLMVRRITHVSELIRHALFIKIATRSKCIYLNLIYLIDGFALNCSI